MIQDPLATPTVVVVIGNILAVYNRVTGHVDIETYGHLLASGDYTAGRLSLPHYDPDLDDVLVDLHHQVEIGITTGLAAAPARDEQIRSLIRQQHGERGSCVECESN